MFTKHNNKPRSNQSKPRCNHPSIEIVPNVRCNHSPLAGESLKPTCWRCGEGAINNFINSNAQLNPNSFAPSQNFLAENFTLPQGEGDEPVSLTSDFIKCRFVSHKGRVIAPSFVAKFRNVRVDCTELDNGDYKELVENSKINFKITKLKKTFKNSTT